MSTQQETLQDIYNRLNDLKKIQCIEAARCTVSTSYILEDENTLNTAFEPDVSVSGISGDDIDAFALVVKAELKTQWDEFLSRIQLYADNVVNVAQNPPIPPEEQIKLIKIYPTSSIEGYGSGGIRWLFSVTQFKLSEVAHFHQLMLSQRLMIIFQGSPYSTTNRTLGAYLLPLEVPESLLNGYPLNAENPDSRKLTLYSMTDVLTWFIRQFDALMGQFPVELEIDDIDPFTAGNQSKVVKLPNLAEAIAEIYGLAIKGTINSEVLINLLVRTATEVVSTKNATIITQDYARANAGFLGYKGNPKSREIDYAVDLVHPNQTQRVEDLLKSSKGYVTGWQLEDNESVVGYLQKLMFSAGIIKAVFFRGKKEQKRFEKVELKAIQKDAQTTDKRYDDFIKEINNPNSPINKDTDIKPDIDKTTP